MQTGSYALLNQFPNRAGFAHHRNLLRNTPPPGHVPAGSYLHGTSQYEYRRVNAVHFLALPPPDHYVQSVALFCVLNRCAAFPSATLHADRFPSTHHQAGLLLATSVHATCPLWPSALGLAVVLADSPVPGSPESLHGCYGIKYGRYHDGLTVHEWRGNAVPDGLQYDDRASLPKQPDDLLPVACRTSVLQQFWLFADTALLHPGNGPTN